MSYRRSKDFLKITQHPPPFASEQFEAGHEEGGRVLNHRDNTVLKNSVNFINMALSSPPVDQVSIIFDLESTF